MSHIILLNGVSSVGKSSVARALQGVTDLPLLHVQMDAFLEMLPPRAFGSEDGYAFVEREDGGKPSVEITSGALMALVMRCKLAATAAMASEGVNVVLDDVNWDDSFDDYRSAFAAHAFHAVALVAPLELIEAREAARGDRALGLARWQYDRVHRGKVYDLTLDTSVASPAESAARIKAAFTL